MKHLRLRKILGVERGPSGIRSALLYNRSAAGTVMSASTHRGRPGPRSVTHRASTMRTIEARVTEGWKECHERVQLTTTSRYEMSFWRAKEGWYVQRMSDKR